MSRYIKADDLKAKCDIVVGDATVGIKKYVTFHEIDDAPSIDFTLCGECESYIFGGCSKLHLSGVNPTDGCTWGERKDDE